MNNAAQFLQDNIMLIIPALLLAALLLICLIWTVSATHRRHILRRTEADLQQARLDLAQKAYDDKSWQGDINALEQEKSRAQTELNKIEREIEILSGERRRLQAELLAAQKAADLPPAEGEEYKDWLRRCEAAAKQQAAAEQLAQENQPMRQKAGTLLAELCRINAAMPFMQNLSDDFPAWVDAAGQKIAADRAAEQDLTAAEKERANLAAALEQKQAKLTDLTTQAARTKAEWQDKIKALFGGGLSAEMAGNITALQNLAEAQRQAAQNLAEQRENAELLAQSLKQLPAENGEMLKPAAIALALDRAEEERQLNDAAFRQAVAARTEAQRDWDNIGREDETAQLAQQKMTLGLELQDLLQNYAEQNLGLKLAQNALAAYRKRHRSGMMLATEKAFAALTNGAYPHLQTSLEGNNEVLQAVPRNGGGLKRADAMSKGTRFQLYMALRAAAYEQLLAQGKNLPFFCDDVFESFDDERTRAACRLMQHIGAQGQAIYFTHHRHVAEIAKEICGDNVQIHTI